jgi:signal transduction histidine kinase
VLHLNVGPESLSWQIGDGKEAAEESCCLGLQPDADLSAVAAALEGAADRVHAHLAKAQSPRATALHVTVWDSWVAYVMLPWSADLIRPKTAEAYALRQLRDAGFPVLANDRLCFDDAPYGEPRMVVAYGAPLVQGAEALARALKLPLESLQTASARAWSRARQAGKGYAALGLNCDRHALLVHGDRRVAAVVARRLVEVDAAARRQEIEALWNRVRVRDALVPTAAALEVLDDAQAGRGTRHGAFEAAVTRHGLRRLVLLAAAAVVALYGLLQGASAAWRVRESQQALHEMRTAAAARAEQPQRPVMSKEEVARERAAQAALQELRAPFGELLSVLEPPKDVRIALLSVEWQRQDAATGGSRAVRVDGEAQSAYDMVRYASFLATRAPLKSARLRQHEVQKSGQVRFSMDAGWSE